MRTYELMEKVIGTNQDRANSCYFIIDGVLLRIADHQANNTNFEAYNEGFNAILNVIISDDFVSEKDFNAYLDENNVNGEILVVSESENIDDVVETIKYYLNRLK